MVKPSSPAGQRRRAISWRRMRGRVGAMSVASAARTAAPAAAASWINFSPVGKESNRLRAFTLRESGTRSHNPSILRGLALCRELHELHAQSRVTTLPLPASKAEQGLQFNFSIGGGTGRKRPPLKRSGLVEQVRAQNPVWVRNIDVVARVAGDR